MKYSPPTRHAPSFSWVLLCGAAVALTLPAPGATYVGSETCRLCHSGKYNQLAGSVHSKMIRPNAHLPGVIHGDLRKPNAPTTNDVHWVMGGCYKEESYIRTNWTGSNWTYTVTQFQWDPIKETYVSNQSLRDWTVKCAACHTTGYNPATRSWKELNIGCEACHGPSSAHCADPDSEAKKPDKRTGAQQGGIVEDEGYIDRSNVMLVNPEDNKPSRVRIETRDDKRVRVFARGGQPVPEPPIR